jgi:hypothetical protein
MYKDKIDRLIHLLIEGESSIMSQKITNPDTGRKIKVSSALAYKDGSTVKQKAEQLLKKLKSNTEDNESQETKIPEENRKQVVTLLDKLKVMSDEANSKGETVPNYDLCKVSVPGTNLFCQASLDIPRAEMPQLKGKAIPGTPADKLPKDNKGEVDTEALFKEALKQSGAKMTAKKVDASTLKATQSQLVGSKVAGMTDALKKDPTNPGITAPIFVSKDGYILDGHHRWAAQVGLSLNKDKPVMMNVVEVDMDAKQLVDFTNKFCNDIGIKQKKGQVKESYLKETTPMKKQIKLSEAIAAIEKKTGKKLQLVESDCYDAKKMSLTEDEFDANKMSLTEEFTTADIAVPDAPALEPMKKGTKLNNDADYLAEGEQECLTEDIPNTKVSAEEPKEGFQKLKSLASQFKMHIEESSIKTAKGVQKSYAITYPKKFQITFTFAYKLNKLGYTMVVDSMGKYKLHIIQKPATK